MSKREYILGDLTYPLSKHLITPYKKPPNSRLPRQKRIFNFRLSGLRICVEHTIGMLKVRFGSLRALLHKLKEPDAMHLCLQWIGSCVILHNLLLDLDDGVEARWNKPDDDSDSEDELSDNSDIEETEGELGSTGKQRRDELMRAVIDELNDDYMQG